MKKELKSCTVVLLRAHLTGYGHWPSKPILQKGWDSRAQPCQASSQKETRAAFQYFFHYVLLPYQQIIPKNWIPIFSCYNYFLLPYQQIIPKNWETYFALLYFWTFAKCQKICNRGVTYQPALAVTSFIGSIINFLTLGCICREVCPFSTIWLGCIRLLLSTYSTWCL